MTGSRKRQLGPVQKQILKLIGEGFGTSGEIASRIWPEQERFKRKRMIERAGQALRVLRMKGYIEVKSRRGATKVYAIRDPFAKRGGMHSGMIVHIGKPYELNPGFVYVVGDEDRWEVIRKDESSDQRVIVCSRRHCYRPAVQLDHFFPFFSDFTLCEVHK